MHNNVHHRTVLRGKKIKRKKKEGREKKEEEEKILAIKENGPKSRP